MATVRAFEIPGFQIWFWPNDHTPPHFHIKRSGEWELRVQFQLDEDMFDVKWANRQPSRKELKDIRKLVVEHRAELQVQWDEIHGT